MPTREATAACPRCHRQVLARRQAPSHLVHFILTVLTLGLWGIIWLLAAIFAEPWRCAYCGAKVSPAAFR